MKFLLAGQPNCGKSTIFNAVAGYRSATANFPGSSVNYIISRALINGREVDIVDLPGLYSLQTCSQDVRVAVNYILGEDWDLIVNVVDASRLERSLELSLQLLELRRPMIIALNMMDEAGRHGMDIDVDRLADMLGVPVIPTIGRRGQGLRELFRTGLRSAHLEEGPNREFHLDREVESAISQLSEIITGVLEEGKFPRRFLAIRILEKDPEIGGRISEKDATFQARIGEVVGKLEEGHGWPADEVVSGSRHALAHRICHDVVHQRHAKTGWRERVDRVLLHPLSGGPVMLGVLAAVFWTVFGVGHRIEAPLVSIFELIQARMIASLPHDSLIAALAGGAFMGLAGGITIVLPYLIPFLLALALLEDSGYLPRMAYILDNVMHHIGLHGKSVVPMILGYGCSVPAIMATRILETRRDRRITAALAAFIPCSARTIVIYGLVAAFIGPWWAMGIYVLNILVILIIGKVLSSRLEGRSPGLILEIPNLELPSLKSLTAKTWLNLKEFLIVAWPVLVGSSVLLAVLEWANADLLVNRLLEPLTVWALGLPLAVGMTLIFGLLRKELTLVMLVQALGSQDISKVMSVDQIVIFTLFVVFYVPCVATIAAMARELGWKDTGWISALTVVVALVIALGARLLFAIV